VTAPFSAEQTIDALIGKGWRWDAMHPDVLLHPEDHNLRIRYNRLAHTLSVSPELERALDLVIATPASKSKVFRH
jgi:hypothetical protein